MPDILDSPAFTVWTCDTLVDHDHIERGCPSRTYIAEDALREWIGTQDGPTIWALERFLDEQTNPPNQEDRRG